MNNLSFLRHSLLRGHYSNPFTLIYTAEMGGAIVGASSQIVDAGNSGAPVTAVANANYRFIGWSDGVATATRTDTNVGGNITVTANFVVLSYTVTLPLERGPHTIYAQATDAAGTVTTAPIVYVAAYELTEYGIDLYSGDAKLDAIEPLLHDELLPSLPTLNFSCATLLSGPIRAVIRERGLRQYQFVIATVSYSDPYYQYTCKAAEESALTADIVGLQTAYGPTSDAIALLAPMLNVVNPELLTQTTYPQMFASIQPIAVIDQLMIQALAQGSVRNGRLYVFPLDVSAQVPDYHMRRLDPLTTWQQDATVYDAVRAHYIVKQYPTPATVLTLNDAANWIGAVSNVSQVATTLLPVPSGALGMLKSVGNCSRAMSTLFKYFDRVQFNWLPVTATSLTVSLQQDVNNKLEVVHAFAGQRGAGFVLNTGAAPTDTLVSNITLSPVQYVTTVTGTTTANCSYRVTLLDAGGAPLWQDAWRSTISNTFEADVPTSVSQVSQATTVRIEFTSLYLITANYGVQCITCYIQVQTWSAVGTHDRINSNTSTTVAMHFSSGNWGNGTAPTLLFVVPTLTGNQWYEVIPVQPKNTTVWLQFYIDFGGGNWVLAPRQAASWGLIVAGPYVYWYVNFGGISNYMLVSGSISATLIIHETITDYAWVSSYFMWSPAFNLFEAVNIPFVGMVRTGNPVNLQTIVLTFAGDNYLDTLVFMADNPLPVTVQAGTGARVHTVTEDFGSEAGALAYANGLLPIISAAREQYTRDTSLSTDLGVGDTVDGDGTNFTVYAIDYRQDGKTLAAGRALDTLQSRLSEQSRQIDALGRKI